ncbi:MAG: GNAT family N-acetyltransferase [Pseudomonadota bacterium]|nr:GNAT family N-acetyltransferase [Pseudomonadota bacterium]
MNILTDKIFTRRLLLRKTAEADLPLLVEWSNCVEIYGDFLTPEQMTIEEGKRNFAAGLFWNGQSRTFIIELQHEGIPIGTIHYWLRSENREVAIVALKIARLDLRNQGYGTEAQKFLIMHLFEKMMLKAIEMYTDIDNLSQQRCLKKLGFKLVDSLQYEDQQINRTGHLFRLTLEDYKQVPLYKFHYE